MSLFRNWFKKLPDLGYDFWLALPLIGAFFWFGGELLSDRVLSLPEKTAEETEELQANTRTRVQLSFAVLMILVQIDMEQGFTEVEVKTNDANVKELDFVFAVTEFEAVEMAIARELNLSLEEVRMLARYQIIEK